MANDVEIRVRVRSLLGAGLGSARSEIDGFTRDASGRLRDLRGRFASEGAAAGRGLSDGLGGSRRGFDDVSRGADQALGALGSMVRGAAIVQWAVPAAASVAQLAGILLTLPAAAAAGIAIFQTFGMITGGLSEAIGAELPKAAAAGGQSARAMARQIESAQRSIADAERGVVQAERQVAEAHKDVERATQTYADALADEQRAQQAVARARVDAQQALDDLNESVHDSALDQKGAALALQRANEQLVAANKDVHATALDREEAAYAVEVAEERVRDVSRESTDAATKLAEANAKGVDGSDQVVAAQDAVVDAQKRTADAADGVTEANQRVTDAEDAVDQAHQRVADANQALADTYADQAEAAGGAAGGANAYADAMSKLGPNARELVTTLRGLSDEWDGLTQSVQERGLEGLAADVQDLANVYLPVLRDGLGGIADELNDMAQNTADALLEPSAVEDVNTLLADTALMLDGADTAVADLVSGLLGLVGVGAQYLPAFGQWIGDIAGQFKDWVDANDGAGGKIEGWIDSAIDGFHDLWDIGSNVFDIISSIATGISGDDGGDSGGFLQFVSDLTQSLADFAANEGVQTALGIVGDLAGLLIDTLPIWGPFVAGIWLVIEAVKIWTVVQGFFNLVLKDNPIGIVITLIGLLVGAFIYAYTNSETFRNIVNGAIDAVRIAFGVAIDAIVGAFNWLKDTLTAGAGWISDKLSSMWGGLQAGAKAAVNGAITILNGLITAANVIVRGLNIINPFGDIPYIPYVSYLAKGGIASGLAVVGERGRELVQLPSGSRVLPHGDTERALSGDGGGGGGAGGQLRVVGDSDSALATLIARMIRTGELVLEPAA